MVAGHLLTKCWIKKVWKETCEYSICIGEGTLCLFGLAMPFGFSVWQFCSVIHFGYLVWQSCLEILFGNLIWQFSLAICFVIQVGNSV
jgi:hypothetical protein